LCLMYASDVLTHEKKMKKKRQSQRPN